MKNIVVIGGGSGIFNVLVGLKKYDVDITAIVSMADTGGSTGVLRNEFGILPPGDVRKCLVALSESSALMKEVFSYRFAEGGCLEGHSLGNLFLTALKKVTGSEEKAILEASSLLKIKGHVLPVTLDDAQLCVELEDGQIIKGETNIDVPKHNPKLKIENAFLEPEAHAYHNAVRAIENADLVVIGPGDLYSSIAPNLLVKGVPEAIIGTKATVVYICNIMTKYGETNSFTAGNFLDVIERYLGHNVVDKILVNDNNIPEDLIEKYQHEGAEPVKIDEAHFKDKKVEIVKEKLLSKAYILRHDPDKIAKVLMGL